MDAYTQSRQQLLDQLGVQEHKGLSEEQAVDNAVRFGINQLSRPAPESLLKKIGASLTEPMILMLIIAAIIAFGVNYLRGLNGGETEYIECIGIVVAVILSVSISLIMEGKSAKAFEALNKIKDDIPAKVMRNGIVRLINQKDIVVGDIVYVETGAKIPADGRLLESVDLRVEEASLTGESEAVKKDAEIVFTDPKTPLADRRNMLYSGTFITAGSGR
ncbi:MAG: HAD-IC family P-type ATPase, partial [Alphaproteobacteria bacterium]|nr:HAD-IC family P-type ATPase [Alphaproteobacteria bacterium]